MKLYMFRTVRLSIIRSLFTVHSQWYRSYRFIDSFRAGPGWNWFYSGCWWIPSNNMIKPLPSWSCSKAVYKPVWHTPLLSVQWINSWWWTDELSETCRVSWQNKFVKLVHLFGFITKKYVLFLSLAPKFFGIFANLKDNVETCRSQVLGETRT